MFKTPSSGSLAGFFTYFGKGNQTDQSLKAVYDCISVWPLGAGNPEGKKKFLTVDKNRWGAVGCLATVGTSRHKLLDIPLHSQRAESLPDVGQGEDAGQLCS